MNRHNLKNFLRTNDPDILSDEQATSQQLEQVLWIIENQAIRSSSEIGQQVKELTRWMVSKLLKTEGSSNDKLGTTAIRLWLAFEPDFRLRVFDKDYGELNQLINKHLTAVSSHELVYLYLMNLMRKTTGSVPAVELPAELTALVMRFYGNGMKSRSFEILNSLILATPPTKATDAMIRDIPKVVLGEWFINLKSTELIQPIFQRLKGVVSLDEMLSSFKSMQEGLVKSEKLKQAMGTMIEFLSNTGDVNTLVNFLDRQQELLSAYNVQLADTVKKVD